MDQQTYLPIEMQFYISVMLKITGYGPTDGPTDRRTDRPSYRDVRTHLKTLGKEIKGGGSKK